jgi:hypothetical protein
LGRFVPEKLQGGIDKLSITKNLHKKTPFGVFSGKEYDEKD